MNGQERESIRMDELSMQAFINRQPTSRTRKWLERLLASHSIQLKTTTELDSPGHDQVCTVKWVGFGDFAPLFAIEREVARERIASR